MQPIVDIRFTRNGENLLMKFKAFLLYLFALINFCCNRPKHAPFTDTPTSGEIMIVVDESYRPLIEVQKDTFMEIYKYAKINIRYLPEAEVFKELMNNDTIRLAITSRDLTKDEKSYFESRKSFPRGLKVAEDAITLIVNKDNPDTAITYEQLEAIIQGKISSWKQLNTGSKIDSIRVVFDKNGSSNARFLKERFLKEKNFGSNFFATNSNAAVVDYVSQNKNSIGVIGVNWISDRDDSTTVAFLKKINVVALSMPDTGKSEIEFHKPFQAYIALKKYPLLRDVTIIIREGRNGLGTGFASFVAGDQGQRLIRLTGLLPATMPVRIIKVN
jgi:phosphate transport system substrate-binding protein